MRWLLFRLEFFFLLARALDREDLRVIIGIADEMSKKSGYPRYESEVAVIALRKGLIFLNSVGGLDKYLE